MSTILEKAFQAWCHRFLGYKLHYSTHMKYTWAAVMCF